MLKTEQKGVPDLYDDCCDGSFYEWINTEKNPLPQSIVVRQICSAPIWYNDDEALTLTEDKYDSLNELNSTWKLAHISSGTPEKRLPHRPYKQFQLESEDNLLVVKCKVRPVLLIKKVSCDWRIPGNTAKLFHSWLCLPLFSYKPRHSQQYVIQDQSFKRAHHFYFPQGSPGLDYESAGKLLELQFIPQKNLSSLTKLCITEKPEMRRPFGLTEKAFHSVLGHISSFLPGIELAGQSKEWYDFFVELVQEEIAKIV